MKLVCAEDAKRAKGQHKRPCPDCPWSRDALPGWLGSMTAEQWVKHAHSDGTAECHALLGAHCAGLAIYRSNVAKKPRDPNALTLPADRERVFASPCQFVEHHTSKLAIAKDTTND